MKSEPRGIEVTEILQCMKFYSYLCSAFTIYLCL